VNGLIQRQLSPFEIKVVSSLARNWQSKTMHRVRFARSCVPEPNGFRVWMAPWLCDGVRSRSVDTFPMWVFEYYVCQFTDHSMTFLPCAVGFFALIKWMEKENDTFHRHHRD
jgi:hypothetical protein